MRVPLGVLVGVWRLCEQDTPCWYGLEGNCDPDQAGISASLIKAVSGPGDWIEVHGVFHSPEVLRSHGGSCGGPYRASRSGVNLTPTLD